MQTEAINYGFIATFGSSLNQAVDSLIDVLGARRRAPQLYPNDN